MVDVRNTDDLIDSRDVIARIDELTDERAALVDALETDADDKDAGALALAQEALEDWDTDNADELKALQSLAGEAEGYADDWRYGATLVRDDHFTAYARDMLEDCGDLPRDLPHYIEIDWDATARNIQSDYTSVDFDGVTYWVR